jgi:hypothetical protein
MLDRRYHQRPGLGANQPSNRQIVRLRAATGENQPIRTDSAGSGAKQLADGIACVLQQLPSSPTRMVLAGGIPRGAEPTLAHDLGHFRMHRGRRVVVQIDWLHG